MLRIGGAVAIAALVAVALLGGVTDVLLAMPLVALLSALLAGRYPGLNTIVRLAARLRRPRIRGSRTCNPARGFESMEPRALRLLVGSRELRGPPSAQPAGL